MNGDRLAPSVRLLRFVPDNAEFLRSDARLPTQNAFRPTAADEAEAQRQRRPVAISVTDLELCTEEQARAQRTSDKPARSFVIFESDVEAVANLATRPELYGVRAEPPHGHCGIQGVGPHRGSSRADKLVRQALADRCAEFHARPVLTGEVEESEEYARAFGLGT